MRWASACGTGRPVEADFLLSHYHYDHLQGLPFFAPLVEPENRFVFHGPPRDGQSVKDVLEGQMVQPYFPVTAGRVPRAASSSGASSPVSGCELGAVRVTSIELNHPGGNLGYRVECRGRSVVYATDVEHADRPAESLVEFARGADLLIYDAMYTDDEYEQRRGWGHSTWAGALATAEAAQVKTLVLFHHDPERDDRALDAVLKRVQKQIPPDDRRARKGSRSASQGRPGSPSPPPPVTRGGAEPTVRDTPAKTAARQEAVLGSWTT